jgi:hypothetical protein
MKVNVMTVMTDLITIAVMTRQFIIPEAADDGEFPGEFQQALGRAPKDPRGLGPAEPSRQGIKGCFSSQVPLLEDSS